MILSLVVHRPLFSRRGRQSGREADWRQGDAGSNDLFITVARPFLLRHCLFSKEIQKR